MLTDNNYKILSEKIFSAFRKYSRLELFRLLSFWVFAVTSILLLIVVPEMFLFLNSSARKIVIGVFVLIAFASFVVINFKSIKRIVRPKKVFDPAEMSGIIGSGLPGIGDELKNCIQIAVESRDYYSADLIRAEVERMQKKTECLDFSSVFKLRQYIWIYLKNIISAAAIMILVYAVPELHKAASRIYYYDMEFTAEGSFVFKVFPGNASVTKGERTDIRIEIIGVEASDLTINIKQADQNDFIPVILRKDSSGIFKYNIASLNNSIKYYAAYQGKKSSVYELTAIERPEIRSLKLTIKPPGYSGLGETVQTDNGNITCLPGSSISLETSSGKKLKKALVVFSDSTKKDLKISGVYADGSFTVRNAGEYYLALTDEAGIENKNPVVYSIKLLEDLFPEIELIEPAKDVNIPLIPSVIFRIGIKDDFGFSSLKLNYRLSASAATDLKDEYSVINIPINNNSQEQLAVYLWDISGLGLKEGDAVSCFAEVFDNDNISGPKSARTGTINLRVPSLDELFAESRKSQNEMKSGVSEIMKEADELRQEMKKISENLRKDSKELSWEEKKSIENAAEKFNSLKEKIEELSRETEELRKEMMKNNLLSEETAKKYMEMQQLLEEMKNDEMFKALQKMQEMMSKMNRQEAQKSVEDIRRDEEYIRKSIERTMNLLKRIQIEQKMDEVSKRAEDIQNDLSEQSRETAKNKSPEDAVRKQEKISEKIENFEKQIEELEKKMSEFDDMPNEEMKEISKKSKTGRKSSRSKEISQMMRQRNFSKASEENEELSEEMQEMQNSVQQMQQQMQSQNQMKNYGEMMQILDGMIEISKQQESLKEQLKNAGSKEETGEISRKQSGLTGNLNGLLNRMSGLSNKTFSITPEMGKALGMARQNMNRSMQSMVEGNTGKAGKEQTDAMSDLNKAASMMKGSMQQMMSGGKGGGMMSLMEQMEKLAGQQMSMNQLAKSMQGEGLSPEQQAAMERLSQGQEGVRKALEELYKEMQQQGSSKKLSSNLEKILEEMQEVVKNINSSRVDDQLVKKQENILSRMLEASRSINERDYEDNRKGTAGKDIAGKNPGSIIQAASEKSITDEINKSASEGYKKDYRDLIRKYLNELNKRN